MIKNKELVIQVLEILQTIIEGSESWIRQTVDKNSIQPSDSSLGVDIFSALEALEGIVAGFKAETRNDGENMPHFGKFNADLILESAKDSMSRLQLAEGARQTHKLEFEFIPLIRVLYDNIYFYGLVYGNDTLIKEYEEETIEIINENVYVTQSIETGKFKYDLTIVVMSYNKLSYTKMCVESLLKYQPKTCTFEIILVNHGSSDGTKEYFESINPNKQLDIKINGGGSRSYEYIREGEFLLFISNDVLVTENAIDNMYECMKTDKAIAKIVPTTTNVSNLQTIPAEFSSTEEMYIFASQNNVYDEYRHEIRTRLCDPIYMECRERRKVKGKLNVYSSACDFPDDYEALNIRRAGCKSILMKDAFCYHFGSITLKEEIDNKNRKTFYEGGRKKFLQTCGIDPWGTGFCYDYELFKNLKLTQTEHVDILGLNCGIGSNPLKIRESLKELQHNLDVNICNLTDRLQYMEDLRGISNEIHLIKKKNELASLYTRFKYDYIIWEQGWKFDTSFKKEVQILIGQLKTAGNLIIKATSASQLKHCQEITKNIVLIGNWIVIGK